MIQASFHLMKSCRRRNETGDSLYNTMAVRRDRATVITGIRRCDLVSPPSPSFHALR